MLIYVQFSSSPSITPQSSQSNLRKRTSIVPAVLHNPRTAAAPATAMVFFSFSFFFSTIMAHSHALGQVLRTPSRQLASDNDSDGDDDIEDININMDGIDNHSDESPGSDGNNRNDLRNQLEEWEEDQDDNDDTTSARCGDKCPHLSTVHSWRKPVKVHVTMGAKPKAGDYEIAVKKVLNEAIPLYRGHLSMVTPYPGLTEEMRWAKKSWKDACEECQTRMAPNDEIIRLVSVRANAY